MKNVLFTVMFIILWFCPNLSAQTVDDYFHTASNFYVNGKNRQAKESVQTGLQIYPTDKKLNSLAGLIKEEEEQEQQQDSQEQQEGDQQEDQEQQSGDQDEQQDQQAGEEEQEQQGQAVEKDKDEMSKEDAERILEALKNDEQDNQKLRKPIKGRRRTTDKDW